MNVYITLFISVSDNVNVSLSFIQVYVLMKHKIPITQIRRVLFEVENFFSRSSQVCI